MTTPQYIRWFADLTIDDVPSVGGKNASLGEMVRELSPLGVKIPNGFAITADGYWHLLEAGGIKDDLFALFEGLDRQDVGELSRRGAKARDLILLAGLPDDLWAELRTAYRTLCAEYGSGFADVAVRSSATAEDLPTASFAGQQETFLNVVGEAALKEATIKCFASLYTDRAIAYRIDQGFDHRKVALSVGVMKMVRSDLASSGVMFTLDTESGFRDAIFVTGAYGLGENVVQGAVDPDEWYLFKPTLRRGFGQVLRRHLGEKAIKMIYSGGRSGGFTRNVSAPESDRARFCLSDPEVVQLGKYALAIEDHYSRRAGSHRPMDIEWAKDGATGELFIVQARPETVRSQESGAVIVSYILEGEGAVLTSGRAVGAKVASGPIRVVSDPSRMDEVQPGDILVADITTPDWEPVMKRSSAIVTNRGGRTCHAAIVARELGIPAVVGAGNATERLATGQAATVDCSHGDEGRVLEGALPFRVERLEIGDLRRPKTQIEMNLGDPEQAFKLSFIPNDGVGLARLELIINGAIGIHPMALVHPERLTDPQVRGQIAARTKGYENGGDFFVEKLAEGVATIAAAFYPKPVIVRMSDFKSNEYANLLGGADFELVEENPMIGFRGASRYAHPAYADGFALECRAMKRVRDDMGLTNVALMIPFCRRFEEGQKVLAEMERHGLKRGENGLQVWVMCEIPSNVLDIDRFATIFDGFSIGSNDLTQLTLGVDRDSGIVAFDFDERDPAVLNILKMAIEGAHRNGRPIGICGQGPSDHPDLAELLVKAGIDAMSLNPDTVMKTTMRILEVEGGL
ncbi:MAG: phosphoenolpyruvate synthase [Alphaproteobacteria bacterium CG_4_10_14_0_2_um_filter_63_37]|nr:MAG: phosphoenolpyruvate synthase [Proteobacteria bacterium CG1_02_64_396]PJA26005.1 MAG: phosphoenolpyruvate synthase [Alphaproteobacteria bacterium CG_4_10_14_0_2_um_filter_63_37]